MGCGLLLSQRSRSRSRYSDDQQLRVGAILGVLRADLQSFQALASQAQDAKIMELERDVFQPLEDKAYDDVLALLTGEQLTVWETIAKPRPRRRPREPWMRMRRFRLVSRPLGATNESSAVSCSPNQSLDQLADRIQR